MPASVYLDYAATTPVDPQVAAVMSACLHSAEQFANPASSHSFGDHAKNLVSAARASVAGLINARPEEIIWTSGATEANNLAILGTARFRRSLGRHVVTSVTEHASVLECFRLLETEGFQVTYLPPDTDGIVAPEAVSAALRADTILVSIMHVNNETGVLQDIGMIGRVCRERGVLFHSDAVQSAGRESLDVQAQSVDLLSLSAHKMYGPKGSGALFLNRQRVPRVEPLFRGGSQQRSLRPGTLATHQIVGFGEAAMLARERLPEDPRRARQLCDELWQRIGVVPGVLLNGHPDRRCCHILNVSVADVEGESLLLAMEEVAVSSGSACSSDHPDASAVLKALGRPDHLAQSSIRFSVGRSTTAREIGFAAGVFLRAVERLRALTPFPQAAPHVVAG